MYAQSKRLKARKRMQLCTLHIYFFLFKMRIQFQLKIDENFEWQSKEKIGTGRGYNYRWNWYLNCMIRTWLKSFVVIGNIEKAYESLDFYRLALQTLTKMIVYVKACNCCILKIIKNAWSKLANDIEFN
jgi:hypothetical protein